MKNLANILKIASNLVNRKYLSSEFSIFFEVTDH